MLWGLRGGFAGDGGGDGKRINRVEASLRRLHHPFLRLDLPPLFRDVSEASERSNRRRGIRRAVTCGRATREMRRRRRREQSRCVRDLFGGFPSKRRRKGFGEMQARVPRGLYRLVVFL